METLYFVIMLALAIASIAIAVAVATVIFVGLFDTLRDWWEGNLYDD